MDSLSQDKKDKLNAIEMIWDAKSDRKKVLDIVEVNGINYKKNKVVYSDLYLKYQYPEEEYFGKELYSEIDHQSSPDEIECGKEIIDKINIYLFSLLSSE